MMRVRTMLASTLVVATAAATLTGCSSSEEGEAKAKPEEIARTFYKAYAARDWKTYCGLMTATAQRSEIKSYTDSDDTLPRTSARNCVKARGSIGGGERKAPHHTYRTGEPVEVPESPEHDAGVGIWISKQRHDESSGETRTTGLVLRLVRQKDESYKVDQSESLHDRTSTDDASVIRLLQEGS
ncbi:hypothetical protein [Streptomyces sp. bgisy100]|uniref:hypothetical protein n=1 Tax=Streptomyces sp. bgisy100 TaxID=3413783 RepID=UPI003D71DA40